MRELENAFNNAMGLATDIKTWAKISEEDLQKFEDVVRKAQEGIDLGPATADWASEVAMLGDLYGFILAKAVEFSNGATNVVDTVLGDVSKAQALLPGEAYEMELSASGEAGGDIAGGVEAGKLGARAAFGGDEGFGYNRLFRVEGIDMDGAQGVEITVTFVNERDAARRAEGGLGPSVGGSLVASMDYTRAASVW